MAPAWSDLVDFQPVSKAECHLNQESNHVGESSTSCKLESGAPGEVEHVAVAAAVKQGGHCGGLGKVTSEFLDSMCQM